MKKLINYYFDLYPNKIIYSEDMIYFYYKDEKYYIKETSNEIDARNIYNLSNEISSKNILINKMILGKDSTYIINYRNKKYIIIKVCELEYIDILVEDIRKYNICVEPSKNIYEENELENMIKKADKYEKSAFGFNHEYSKIQTIYNYYIGLAENAISYLYETKKVCKETKKCLSHLKISKKIGSLIDVTNLSLNYKLSDFAQFIQLLMINDEPWEHIFKKYIEIEKLNLTEFDYRYLYSKIIYPYYVFNEKVEVNQNDAITKIKRMEDNFKKIYLLISEICNLPLIDWIGK